MTCTIVQRGFNKQPLRFYHFLRRVGYTHRSSVVSVLMYYSPSAEDLYRRLLRKYEYHKKIRLEHEQTHCTCCGHSNVTVVSCPNCGEPICQDCTPPFGAHVCELE